MTNLLQKAHAFAEEKFEGQVRKVSGEKKFNHMTRVAQTIQDAGFCEELVAAGLLHDTVEDTTVTIDLIQSLFGEKVATFVAANTEDKNLSWEGRKQHTIDAIKTAPLEVKALIVADKLDNLNTLFVDQEILGEKLWTMFKRGKDQQEWYFRSIAKNMKHGLSEKEVPAYFNEFEGKVEAFFG